MNDIDLTPPPFLDVRFRPSPAPYKERRRARWKMPPRALSATSRAIGRGHDTFQKLRKSLRRKYSEAEIREAIQSLKRSGTIVQCGRRYHKV